MIYTTKEIYIGKDQKERQIFAVSNNQLSYNVYIVDENNASFIFAITNNRPYIVVQNNIVYVSSERSPIYWGMYDETGRWSSGQVQNAPLCEYIISWQNSIVGGGRCATEFKGAVINWAGVTQYQKVDFTLSSTRVTANSSAPWANYTTGTVSIVSGGNRVTGSSTLWRTDASSIPNAQKGFKIGFGSTTAPSKYYTIKDVISDTELLLEENYMEATLSAAAYQIRKTPAFTTNVSPGDLIGSGLFPGKYYLVTRIVDDNTLEIAAEAGNGGYEEASASASFFNILRRTNNGIYVSAEGMTTDWKAPGFFGGNKDTFFFTDKANTGLHEFNNALIIFTKEKGFFVTGNSPAEWRTPRSTRLPVGCINHASIVSKNGYIAYMSENGIYISKGGALDLSALEAVPFSSIIQKTYDDIDQDLLHYVNSFVYKDLLFITVPAKSNYSWTDPTLTHSIGVVNNEPSHEYTTGTVAVSQNSNLIDGTGTGWANEPGSLVVINDCNNRLFPSQTLAGTGVADGTTFTDDGTVYVEQGTDTSKGSVKIAPTAGTTAYWEFNITYKVNLDGKKLRFAFKRNSGTILGVYLGLSSTGFATDNRIYNIISDVIGVANITTDESWHILEITPGVTATASAAGTTVFSQIQYFRLGLVCSTAASANFDYLHYINPEIIQPGYLFGVGASPSKWYKIASINSSASITLSEAYAEASASGQSYVIKRQDEVYGAYCAWAGNIQTGDKIRFASEETEYSIRNIDTSILIDTGVPITGKGFYEVTTALPHNMVTGDRVTVSNSSDITALPNGEYQVWSYDDKRFYIPYAAGVATTTATIDLLIQDKIKLLTNRGIDLSGANYTIQKRRNNRILVLDTNTNVSSKKSFGWTIFNNVFATSFNLFKNRLYYGSSIDNYVYEYDVGGTLYGHPFTASFKTARTDCGTREEKHFKSLKLKARGTGLVYVTPIINGVSRTRISYNFTDNSQCQEVFFPRVGNPFSYMGDEIQLLVELEGSDEEIIVYPPQVGWVPRRTKEGV